MYNAIVVGTDGSPSARNAVTRAARMAKLCNARLLIVSAYKGTNASVMSALSGAALAQDDVDARTQVEAMLAGLAAEFRKNELEVDTFAYPGNAAQAILDVAESEQADLIVLGNRGMQGARRYLGSVPSNVAHQAPCSVLIVSTH